MRRFAFPLIFAAGSLLWGSSGSQAVPPQIIGGSEGIAWESGGGEIPALVITSNRQGVEQTNTPGGVIAFSPEGRSGWIFPQRADTTLNIALGAASDARGGSITSPNAAHIRDLLPDIIDGDGETALDLRATSSGQSARVLGIIIDLDLGARFGVDRFKFFPRNADPAFPAPEYPYQNEYMRGYEIFINDGTDETQIEGVPIPTSVAVEGENEEAVVDVRIAPQYVRYVRLKSIASRGFDLAEFQVFGTGYVPEARYVSNVFDFGDAAILGKLRWVQEAVGDPNLSRVLVRTRSGNDAQPVEFNKIRPGEDIFREGGGVASEGAYNPLFAATGGANRSNRPEVPWKSVEDVEDVNLKELIETILDNEQVDVREARKVFKELPLDEQQVISLTEEDYAQLGKKDKADKGAIRDDLINWSGWSPPYPLEGAVIEGELDDNDLGLKIVSPSPRRYFQFMLEFISDDFDVATGIGGLAFEAMQTPFAGQLVAEIAPRTARLGEATRFAYAVLNKVGTAGARGFDRFRVSTPLRVEAVGKVEIQRADGRVEEADFSGLPLDELPVVQGDFSIVEVADRSFAIAFPMIEEDGTLLRLEFENAVLRFGTVFSGEALNSTTDTAIGQDADAGNAADLTEGGFDDTDTQPLGVLRDGNLSVMVPTSRDLLVNVEANPPVFSPNGDGVNDRTLFGYDITNIARPSPLKIDIFDLGGRRVRSLYAAEEISGRYLRAWDGLDDGGNQVPPGNYLFVVSLEAGTGKEGEVGIVSVVY